VAKALKTLDVPSREAWRKWLAKHHDSESEIWLVYFKQHTGRSTIAYADSVDEALCFGWVDSLIRRLDDNRYARKFTPRKSGSAWSTINRQRYARLKATGRLQKPGLARSPTGKSGDFPTPPSKLPRYIATALNKHPAAHEFFLSLTPKQRLQYVAFIDSAKQQSTRLKRLEHVVQRLVAKQKPGLK
jgi:uncharacterized protein YdeI (YjbR/CyaY-like superfamily)